MVEYLLLSFFMLQTRILVLMNNKIYIKIIKCMTPESGYSLGAENVDHIEKNAIFNLVS